MRIAIARTIALSLVLAACASVGSRNAGPAGADSARIRSDIEYLASDALEGRGTGTAGNDSAAAFAARRYRALGLRAMSPGYLQPFSARPAVFIVHG